MNRWFATSLLAFGFLRAEEPELKLPLPPPVSYTSPGTIGLQGGAWVGSDHLLNLTSDLGVVVDVVVPAGMEIPFKDEDIRRLVLTVFDSKKFDINFQPNPAKPPLPFFNVSILIQKIENGYVVSLSGRLFEAVTLKRVILPEEVTFQAITWEKQTLIVVPSEQLQAQVFASVKSITELFYSRFAFFEKEKARLKKEVN